MLERKESSVTIFRGDDTGGQLGKTIVINFHCGDTVNMEGVVVTFILGGFYEKEFHNVHDGDRLEIFMTHEQTAMLPLGVSFGKLYGTDASGKIRTFSNRIPIRVTNRVCEAYGDSEDAEIDVTISNAIAWDSIFGKPETFPPSEHRHQKSDIDNLENNLQTLSDGVKSAIEAAEAAKTEAAKGVRTVNGKGPTDGNVKIVLDDLADKDGNIETTKTIMVSRDGGESHVAVALFPDLISEIDTHNNSVTAHTELMGAVARNYATKTEVEKKYDKTGGPISGDVSISGSLSLTGNAPKITANQKDFSFPTESGKLARAEDYYTMAEVDNKITTFVAHYLTGKDSTGHFVPFATRAALDYAKQHHTEANPQFFYAGEPFTPTKNDYCVVLEDETVKGKTARYSFVGEWPTGSWQYQYTINDTAFSEAQWAAINSGVTSAWMESTLSALQAEVDRAKAAEAQLTTKANELDTNKLDKTAVVAPSASATAGQAADAAKVGEALAMKAPSNITTASDDKIRIVYGDNVWWIVPLGIYYWNDGEAGENAHSPTAVFSLPTSAHDSSFALTSDIDARLPYPLYSVPSTGLLKDRAINTTSLASVTVPDNFADLLVRASVASSLSVTMPGTIATKYGDTFPGEAGEYLITITKTGAAEAYVRTIKLEVANA